MKTPEERAKDAGKDLREAAWPYYSGVNWREGEPEGIILAAIREAVAEEREACAALCADVELSEPYGDRQRVLTAVGLADEIRARGNPPPANDEPEPCFISPVQGSPVGGTFTLDMAGQKSEPLPFYTTPAEVKSALDRLWERLAAEARPIDRSES